MKRIALLVSVLVTYCFSADVYQVVKTPLGTFTNFNAYVTAKGVTPATVQIGTSWAVSGKLVVPSTLDIFSFTTNGKFYGVTGSATDTMVINRMSALPSGYVFDTSLTVIFDNGSVSPIRPEWFGAIGNRVHDDALAIQRAVNSSKKFGGNVHFSNKQYLIKSTIELIDKRGFVLSANSGRINYNTDTIGNSGIYWGGTNPKKPMIACIRGRSNEFRNLILNGRTTFESTDTAQSGILIDEHTAEYIFRGCTFTMMKAGIRIGSTYRFDSAGTPFVAGTCEYTGVYDANAVNNGGFQTDNIIIDGCQFAYCAFAAVSVNSSQCLDFIAIKPSIHACGFGFHITGSQGMTINTPAFIGNDSADILLKAYTSSGLIDVQNSHSEAGTRRQTFFEITDNSYYGNNAFRLSQCGGGKVILRGITTGVIKSCVFLEVNVATDSTNLDIENSRVQVYNKTAAGKGIRLSMKDVYVDTLKGYPFEYDAISIKGLEYGKHSGDVREISTIAAGKNYVSQLMLGTPSTAIDTVDIGDTIASFDTLKVATASDTGKFIAIRPNGTFMFGTGKSLQTSSGQYIDQARTWISSNPSGYDYYIGDNGISYKTFAGATIGKSVGTKTELYAMDSLGVSTHKGPFIFTDSLKTPVLKSQNGTQYRIKVANDGTLSTTTYP